MGRGKERKGWGEGKNGLGEGKNGRGEEKNVPSFVHAYLLLRYRMTPSSFCKR